MVVCCHNNSILIMVITSNMSNFHIYCILNTMETNLTAINDCRKQMNKLQLPIFLALIRISEFAFNFNTAYNITFITCYFLFQLDLISFMMNEKLKCIYLVEVCYFSISLTSKPIGSSFCFFEAQNALKRHNNAYFSGWNHKLT